MKMQHAVNKVRSAEDYFLSLVLKKYQDEPLFKRLHETTIQPLLDYDKVEKYSLFDSLVMYFDCDQNISKAADALYMHRNTMKSRLEKIQELTGRDLEDNFDCLELQIALQYYKLNNYNKKRRKNE